MPPSQRNKLTIVCGNAGTGKTTMGRRLAEDQGAALLDIDTVSEKLVVAGLKACGADPDDRDSPSYKEKYREAIHETLFAIADENLDTIPCIVVAPFTQERRDPSFPTRIEQLLRCPVEVVYLTCSDSIRKQRIIKRNNPRDQAKLDAWESYVRTGADEGPPPFPHTYIENSGSRT